MIDAIEKMLNELERGKLSRRQLAVSLAALAAGASAVPIALAVPRAHRLPGGQPEPRHGACPRSPPDFAVLPGILRNATQTAVGHSTYPGSWRFFLWH